MLILMLFLCLDRDGFLSEGEATAIFNKFDLSEKKMEDVLSFFIFKRCLFSH